VNNFKIINQRSRLRDQPSQPKRASGIVKIFTEYAGGTVGIPRDTLRHREDIFTFLISIFELTMLYRGRSEQYQELSEIFTDLKELSNELGNF
jgi:hypothetical protein